MRGKPLIFTRYMTPPRITPADAGKTVIRNMIKCGRKDHPRGCGENFVGNAVFVPTVRITPADAGKTRRSIRTLHHEGDHPRGCGENIVLWRPAVARRGSPPRMRGKPLFKTVGMIRERITPADAGKTSPISSKTTGIWDHPRGCGENGVTHLKLFTSLGSPPRMRGKQPRLSPDALIGRITPADAGKTCCQATKATCQTGSPPRMRGKPATAIRAASTPRITPADAGKTRAVSPKTSPNRDHPRGCGENCVSLPIRSAKSGITPADAGKTRRLNT